MGGNKYSQRTGKSKPRVYSNPRRAITTIEKRPGDREVEGCLKVARAREEIGRTPGRQSLGATSFRSTLALNPALDEMTLPYISFQLNPIPGFSVSFSKIKASFPQGELI